MKHSVETHANTDQYRRHGQCIEKRRQDRRNNREQKRQQLFGSHIEQDLGEHKKEQILHEVDACHHEHQQQNHLKVGLGLMEHTVWISEPQQYSLDR